MATKYDLKIGTGNAKTGASFSLTAGVTCPGESGGCEGCYAKRGNMGMFHQKPGGRYDKNYQACIQALKVSVTELALALVEAIDATKSKTIRIHDSGDFFSPAYVSAWIIATTLRPEVKFWAYTRSWRVKPISDKLDVLAGRPNVSLWRSTDNEIWIAGLAAHKSSPWAGVAFQQQAGDEDIAQILNKSLAKKQFVNFPSHATGKTLFAGVEVINKIRNCPAIVGSMTFDKASPACLQCKLCLPA